MKITYMINNYTLGAHFKSTPQQYLIRTERIDSRHTRVIYDVPNSKVADTIDKMLGYRSKREG